MQLSSLTLCAWLATGVLLALCRSHSHVRHLSGRSDRGPRCAGTGRSFEDPNLDGSCAPSTDLRRQVTPSGKRGICFNSAGMLGPFSGAVSWGYNWAATETSDLGEVQFVPMMHKSDDVSTFASQVGDAAYVLSFNEPDIPEQADLSPQEAYKYHCNGTNNLFGKVRIGSPAVTNGFSEEPPMGLPWLEQFLSLCTSTKDEHGNLIPCPVDFVAYHWYATADSIEYFKSHTNDVIQMAARYGIRKVWLTEFGSIGSPEDQKAFMNEAINFLESTPAVERYAAFMASDGTLLTGSALNGVGSAYIGQG